MKFFTYTATVLSLLIISFTSTTKAQTTAAAIPGDFPDPTIIRTPKGYYASGTSSEWAPHFPIYYSKDLKNWKQVGYVFDKTPEWTVGSFWAPEYYRINNTYYIYYVARRKADNISCIGVATSPYPDHGFKDHGILIEYGKEAIDPFVFNDNGQLYITFKAYGLDNRPIEIVASKLSPDGLKAESNVTSLLKDDKRVGMEGQSILKHGQYYYLFYAAGDCCGVGCSYHVKVARATSFTGPYEKYEGTEILQPAPGWKCSGHGTFVQTPEGKYYYLCHAYNQRSEVFTGREGMLSTLIWPKGNNWPIMHAMTTLHPLPNIHDDFAAKTPALYWQYDFHNAEPLVKQQNGSFYLSGTMINKNKMGIIYGLRPVSDDFDMTTAVTNYNNALKGLAFYGNINNALGIGIAGKQVKFWMVKDGNFSLIDSAGVNGNAVVELKLNMAPDHSCKAYYRQTNSEWKELATGTSASLSFLPQWDRPQRAGLFFKGPPDENACFKHFDLVNKKS